MFIQQQIGLVYASNHLVETPIESLQEQARMNTELCSRTGLVLYNYLFIIIIFHCNKCRKISLFSMIDWYANLNVPVWVNPCIYKIQKYVQSYFILHPIKNVLIFVLHCHLLSIEWNNKLQYTVKHMALPNHGAAWFTIEKW